MMITYPSDIGMFYHRIFSDYEESALLPSFKQESVISLRKLGCPFDMRMGDDLSPTPAASIHLLASKSDTLFSSPPM